MGPDLSGSSTRLTECKGADSPFAQTLAAARASRKQIRDRVRLHVVAEVGPLAQPLRQHGNAPRHRFVELL